MGRPLLLGALRSLPVPAPSVDDANDRADEILSRPEFQPPEQSWLQRLGERIDEEIGRLLAEVLSAGAASFVT
jgi:tetrahydromethanopterin S-methyltransferase subunit G